MTNLAVLLENSDDLIVKSEGRLSMQFRAENKHDEHPV